MILILEVARFALESLGVSTVVSDGAYWLLGFMRMGIFMVDLEVGF